MPCLLLDLRRPEEVTKSDGVQAHKLIFVAPHSRFIQENRAALRKRRKLSRQKVMIKNHKNQEAENG
jgi:hypothetical protein